MSVAQLSAKRRKELATINKLLPLDSQTVEIRSRNDTGRTFDNTGILRSLRLDFTARRLALAPQTTGRSIHQ
jgi:hypothetical protein